MTIYALTLNELLSIEFIRYVEDKAKAITLKLV